MTQHSLAQHAEEDKQIMRKLALTVAGFMLATTIMAVIIGQLFG